MSVHPSFHPHRLFPRFGRPVEIISRRRGGLALAARLAGPLLFDRQASGTENATAADLRRVRVAVCGFPRTGTTFLQHAVGDALGNQAACWKNHDAFAATTFTDAGIPVLVPLRDPLSTIVSWSLYHHDPPSADLMRSRLAIYLAWHREIARLDQRAGLTMLDFEEFCADPGDVLATALGPSAVPSRVTEDAIERTTDLVLAENDDRDLAINHRNVPAHERDLLKGPYLDAVRGDHVQSMLERANDVYLDLLDSSVPHFPTVHATP